MNVNFSKVVRGNITIVNHSTSATVEVICNDDEGHTQSLWLDWSEFTDLIKSINIINDTSE